jgi:predicted HicB family RNase H-like nuclease
MKKRLIITMAEELHKKIKVLSAESGESMNSLIIQAITYLINNK